VVRTTTGAADDRAASPPAATLALAGISMVTVLAIVSVAAGRGPAVVSIGASWETCRTPSVGEMVPAALASPPLDFAFFADFVSIPGSVCRTSFPRTISPLVASKRLSNTRSRCTPPTSSQGSQKL
jgi:hypothetical protein